MKPLFMWAGGKTKLIRKYKEKNVLPTQFDSYVEPFLGGGAMFVWAYQKNPNAKFVLNDLNKGVMSIYRSIRDDHQGFLAHLDKMSSEYLSLPKGQADKALEKLHNKDWKKLYKINRCRRYYYFKLRNEHAFDYGAWNPTKESAVLYFLMKTGFNGIWQENKNTNGRFGTPAGLLNQKHKVYDKENILEWHYALQGVELLCGDFKDTSPYISKDSFVFLDPPYRGSFTQYGVDFDDKIQESVVGFFNDSVAIGAYTMMSNRDIEDGFFESRKGNNKIIRFDITYTAGRRKKTEDGFEAKKAVEILMIPA
jgi:DNA adenine methylase